MNEKLLVFITFIIVIYLVIVILAYLGQRKMLYFPHTYTLEAGIEIAKKLGLSFWPKNSRDYHGFISLNSPGLSKGVVLIFHGNAGSAMDRFYYMSEIQKLGYRVVLFEYPGYGARPGPLREAAFVNAAIQAARDAVEEFGGPLYVLGESLGCGIASALAGGNEIATKGIIMLTPWDTLPDLAQSHYWFLPTKWLVKDRYDNIKNLQNFKEPIAIVLAEKDNIIPNKHTIKLFESLTGNKKLWKLKDVGHNDWPIVTDRAWWEEIMGFVNSEDNSKNDILNR
ncbi:MAG: alpha/beta fold hydrolase [Pseudomonadota bacterium]